MGWEIHPAKAAFAGFAADWDRLNAEYYDAHPLYDSRFVGPLLSCFSSGKEQLCLFRAKGTITGALILRSDGLGRWSSFRPSQSQATPLLLRDASLVRDLLRALPGFTWSIEFLAIDPRYAPNFAELDLVKIVTPQAQTIGVDAQSGFAPYWERRSKNLKANVRRYLNRAEKEAALPEMRKLVAPDDMAAGVERFGQLESAGWKGVAGTAVSVANRQGEFYVDLLSRFARTGEACIYELRINDALAASRLVINGPRMLVILKTSYDENLARFAPGRLLLYRIIEEQLDAGSGKALEFYTNATRDQADWTNTECTIQNIQIFGNDVAAAGFSLLKVAQRLLRGAKKRRPPATGLLPTVAVQSAASMTEIFTDEYEIDEFVARESFEYSAGWFSLLQEQIYPQDAGVRFYFTARGRSPATILPLRFTAKGQTRTIEGLSNFYTSLYAPLETEASTPFILREMLATATRDHAGAHVMRFAPMDPEAPAYRDLIDGLQAIGWIPFRYFCFGNWFLRTPETWEGYLKKRSGNLRSAIKRSSRKFLTAGGTLEIVTTPDTLEPAIDAFQEVYIASWKGAEPYPEFVPTLIRRLAEAGMLRLGIAYLEGRPIAAQLWIVGSDKASIYKVAYHEEFASYSPGTVLTAHLMQHVIEQDHVSEVDFLIGDDSYKQIWMSHRRERWGIIAYNPRTLIGFGLFLKEVVARTTRSLRLRGKQTWAKLLRRKGTLHPQGKKSATP